MNLLQFVPIKLTSFLVIGIVIGYSFDVGLWISFSITAISLSVLYWLHFQRVKQVGAAFGFWTMISCMGIGFISVSLHSCFNYTRQLGSDAIHDPRLWTLSIREELKSTSYYQRYLANVNRINDMSSNGLMLCRMPKSPEAKLAIGDQILVWDSASEINPPKNPYQFNYKKYMRDQGVFLQLKIEPSNYIKLDRRISRPMDLAQQLRSKIMDQLALQPFGKDELAVIQAILLGYRNDVDKSLGDNYKAAGAMHIMAISGLHIGVILALINFVLRPLNRLPNGKLIKLVISVLVLWSFAFLAGFSASVLRAVTMFTFLAYALYINRPGSIFFMLLIMDPLMLFQVGFQLSYAAVLSIVWLYPKLINLWNPEQWMIRRFWQLFCVGLAAQLGVLPLSLYYFHQFPTLFFVSNLIVVPFLGLVIASGLLVTALVMNEAAPVFLISYYNEMIASMNKIVAWVASQEAFLFRDIYFDQYHLWLSIGLIISFIAMIEKLRYRTICIFLCLIISLQLWNNYTILRAKKRSQIVLLHTTGSTSLLYQEGQFISLYSNKPQEVSYAIKDLKTAERIKKISIDTLRNSYSINRKNWLIIDHPEISKEILCRADIWLLSGSPRINLDRFLSLHKPDRIIADGSNYHGFVDRWRASCINDNIPFYSTGESGSLSISDP